MKRIENLNTPMNQYFELKKAPFPQLLMPKELLVLPHVHEVSQMIEFAFQHNMFYAIIGSVGCGKSSALQYACERLTSRQAKIVNIVGGIWSFTELMRQILSALGVEFRPYQPAVMVRLIQEQLQAIKNDGKKCIIIIDEAPFPNLLIRRTCSSPMRTRNSISLDRLLKRSSHCFLLCSADKRSLQKRFPHLRRDHY